MKKKSLKSDRFPRLPDQADLDRAAVEPGGRSDSGAKPLSCALRWSLVLNIAAEFAMVIDGGLLGLL